MINLVVLGMHRSGTSALTGTLQRLGFHAGNEPLAANEYNEKGYFEDAKIVAANEALLGCLGRSWSDVRLLPSGWDHDPSTEEIRAQLPVVHRAAFDLNMPWVMKDPRLCRLLPLWGAVFSELIGQQGYLILLRHPQAVVRSLARRDGMLEQRAYALYALYLLEAERHTRADRRAVVKYVDLLQDWRGTIQRTFQALDLAPPEAPAAEALALDDFLDRGLCHEEASIVVPSQSERSPWTLASLAYRTYDLLVREEPFADQACFDRLWAELCGYLDSLEPWEEQAAHALRQRDEARSERDRVLQFLGRGGLHHDDLVESACGIHAVSVAYWRCPSDEQFDEKRALRQPLTFNGEQTFRFVLPQACAPGLLALRWDISDRPAACEVREAWVEDPTGARVWRWQKGAPLLADSSADMKIVGPAIPGACIRILALGSDPYGQLLLPEEVLRSMRPGWAFITVVSVRLPTAALNWLPGSYEGTAVKSESTLARLCTELEEISGLLQSALSKRDQTIVQQRHQAEKARLELVRAQAQVQLLKSLFKKQEETRSEPPGIQSE